jgi:hypothetical protein
VHDLASTAEEGRVRCREMLPSEVEVDYFQAGKPIIRDGEKIVLDCIISASVLFDSEK